MITTYPEKASLTVTTAQIERRGIELHMRVHWDGSLEETTLASSDNTHY